MLYVALITYKEVEWTIVLNDTHKSIMKEIVDNFNDLSEMVEDTRPLDIEFKEFDMYVAHNKDEPDTYKGRLVKEYIELNDRIKKLRSFYYDYRDSKLNFQPDSSVDLFCSQLKTMIDYKLILEKRMKDSNIKLKIGDKEIT